MKAKKNKKWRRWYHTPVRNLLSVTLGIYTRIKYNVKVHKHKDKQHKQFLVLFNHQTAFDQFFVGMAFKGAVYYVASEDIFTLGLASSIIKFLVAPIPIKKQSTDVRAVLNCLKVAREGGTIAIAPEGNRTYSGETGYMNPAIAPLVRKLGLPVAFFKIEGGYGVHPRWSDVVRRGKMQAGVTRVVEPEDVAKMSDAELCELIRSELYVNESSPDAAFRSSKRAEYVERMIYVCPKCGISEFHSSGARFSCKGCGLSVEYGEDKSLKAISGELPFATLLDWYNYQCDYVNGIDPEKYIEKAISIESVEVKEVIPYKRKLGLIKKGQVLLYGNRLEVIGKGKSFDIDFATATAFAVLGKNKLNVYTKDKIYQFIGNKRFSALKYMNLFYNFKNKHSKEGENVRFLGI